MEQPAPVGKQGLPWGSTVFWQATQAAVSVSFCTLVVQAATVPPHSAVHSAHMQAITASAAALLAPQSLSYVVVPW